jgi:predicted nucleotide-binding protein (sugar kinase/HSP70/actin superfamily)
MDALDDMLRKCRPYERTPGQIDALYDEQWGNVLKGLSHSNKRALQAFEGAVDAFNAAPLDRSERKPRIGVVGEILLNYHPSANGQLVRYLEKHGMEVHVPGMVDFFRRDLIRVKEGVRRNHLTSSVLQAVLAGAAEKLYQHVTGNVERAHARFRFYDKHANCHELRRHIEDIIDPTYMVGEGWLMPAEIIEAYQHGVRGFVIVQPFGCMPNHITGRGIMKTLKRRCPSAQIVSLDYDPDISFANIENRLMMLIMSVRDLMRDGGATRRGRSLPVLNDDVVGRDTELMQPASLDPAAVAGLGGHAARDEGDAGSAE